MNLAQSETYAFFVFGAVGASTAAQTSERARSDNTTAPYGPARSTAAAASSANRVNRSLGNNLCDGHSRSGS